MQKAQFIKKTLAGTLAGLALATAGAASAAPALFSKPITLSLLGTYATGVFDDGAAEIVAYDDSRKTLFVINASSSVVDMLSIRNPANPTKIGEIDVLGDLPGAGGINSVAVHSGLVAVAVENDNKQANGWIAFYDIRGRYLGSVEAGALPDMVTFSPDGRYVLAANEGEPNDDYSVDPEGTVTIVDLRGRPRFGGSARDISRASVMTATFPDSVHPDVRITGPEGTTVPQDLEPEYIAVSEDSRTAWVTLQENNAMAKIDIRSGVITNVAPLGAKNHMLAGNGLDPSDKDDIEIDTWPVNGLYMPDGMASYSYRGMTYLVTANEGDAREYGDYADVERLKDLTLDPTAFPTASDLRKDGNLGRLNIVTTEGDIGGDNDYDELYSFGARSISIWDANGNQVFDSGDTMEQVTAATFPDYFNASNSNNTKDNRSDDKGPEPEGVAIGNISGRNYAFVVLERIGGIMIFDVTDPANARYVSYTNNRDFTQDVEIDDAANPAAGDLGPEGIIFIDARKSPNRRPLVVVGNEISGTTSIYEVNYR